MGAVRVGVRLHVYTRTDTHPDILEQLALFISYLITKLRKAQSLRTASGHLPTVHGPIL